MLNRYYEQELGYLRNLAAEFATNNPALAPLLGADNASDPDVERLLEGVAFMTGLIRHRLDDDFPEFIQNLAQLLFPHMLRPLPCMTIMRYQPRATLEQSVIIPMGTEFASVPVDGLRTVFRSAFPVTVEPVELHSAQWEGGGTQARSLRLRFRVQGKDNASWAGERLRFFLGDAHADATRWYLLLLRYVREIRISSDNEPLTALPAHAIRPSGFDPALELLPWPAGAHPAWRVLYDYFSLPEKLLFLDIEKLLEWSHRGKSSTFSIQIMFESVPDWAPAVTPSSFILNATPAINLFTRDAHPIRVDHLQPDYRIHPLSRDTKQVEKIFSVDSVRARTAEGAERDYYPFSAMTTDSQASYNVAIRSSALQRDYDHFLSVPYIDGESPQTLTLSLRLTCTHGELPQSLRLGDICEPTDSSPARMGFSNIHGITSYCPPMIDSAMLWRVLSHLNANHLALANEGELRNLLSLYVPARQADAQRHAAAKRAVESIGNVRVTAARRIVAGMPILGSEIQIECRGDHFPSQGGLFLFGMVLDELLAGTTALNTFSALTLIDTVNGETLQWPAKIGRYRLL